MRTRKNIEKMSVEEIVKLKRAYKSLQDETNNGYELIAGIHGLPDPISCPHHLATQAFLPWHRKYLLAFETLLQKYEPDVMLPYWDWATTELPNTPDKLPVACQPDEQNGIDVNPLSTAPMHWVAPFIEEFGDQMLPETIEWLGKGWSLRLPNDESAFERFRTGQTDAMREAEFEKFSNAVEQPHDDLHGYIGHHMGAVETSAFDPIFWMHHSNIDRLWAIWQRVNPNVAQHPFPDAPLREYPDTTTKEVLDITALDYTYEQMETEDIDLFSLLKKEDFETFAKANRIPETSRELQPRRKFIVLENLEMPMRGTVVLNFFKKSGGDEKSLGSLTLFGLRGLSHSHGQMLPFSRRLNITGENISDAKDLKITAHNLEGKKVNINSVLSKPPIISEQ